MMKANATACSYGFDHGNYANAYETQNLRAMLKGIADKSADYRNAAIVGFFGSYSLAEIPGQYRDEYDQAYYSAAGRQCLAAGYLDSRDDEYAAEAEE